MTTWYTRIFECVTSTERTVADWTALSFKRTNRHLTADQRRNHTKKSRGLSKEGKGRKWRASWKTTCICALW